MDIFKKYILIISVATVAMILFVLFAPIEWDKLQTPAEQRRGLIQNCIDNEELYDLTPRECADLYPVDNVMTRPIINTTGWFN